MTKDQIGAIRRLDIKFMHDFMTKERGYPFVAGPSNVNGKMYTADEAALIAAHKLRTRLGSKKERKASIEWLRNEGLLGLFDEALDAAERWN